MSSSIVKNHSQTACTGFCNLLILRSTVLWCLDHLTGATLCVMRHWRINVIDKCTAVVKLYWIGGIFEAWWTMNSRRIGIFVCSMITELSSVFIINTIFDWFAAYYTRNVVEAKGVVHCMMIWNHCKCVTEVIILWFQLTVAEFCGEFQPMWLTHI